MLDLFGGPFVLVRFDGADEDVSALAAAAEQRGVPLTVADVDHAEAAAIYAKPLVLVRPDGHVAWRGDDVPDDPVALIDRVRGGAPT